MLLRKVERIVHPPSVASKVLFGAVDDLLLTEGKELAGVDCSDALYSAHS